MTKAGPVEALLTFVGSDHVVADSIRVLIIVTGFTLAMLSLKAAYWSWRHRVQDPDWGERAWGALAFACFMLSPAFTSLLRFGQPLQIAPVIVYGLGLIAGAVATSYTTELNTPLDRWRRARHARRRREASARTP